MKPTETVRQGTYLRDGFQCVRCGSYQNRSYQHRRRVGAGGSKIAPGYSDGLLACEADNDAFEHVLQRQALRLGWKVKSWVVDPSTVPVFYLYRHQWAILDNQGGRMFITAHEAEGMMRDVYGAEYESWLE